jgi:hypothetical protein
MVQRREEEIHVFLSTRQKRKFSTKMLDVNVININTLQVRLCT